MWYKGKRLLLTTLAAGLLYTTTGADLLTLHEELNLSNT